MAQHVAPSEQEFPNAFAGYAYGAGLVGASMLRLRGPPLSRVTVGTRI